ncbi:putative mitochondrial fatty acid elongase [Leptomonas pyrrhocoris]|uniref:Elongation of fatty acids protein n=1 Tax=Leptomonas pyrrhocoris TaxID=157538 RepID=A0A0M9FWD5_LEPPY|nr:putative mitochondrial fatty acid elongase [Leptomonas pyrrhocoris]KPA77256.1 putative mitochondrial fatty acid elongase [Leptomonas pyrrhocoris]|eukprot:XP_015655695.1 putative mitochondrial fatty acid elongase [Leptomonas pyrrhocoris]
MSHPIVRAMTNLGGLPSYFLGDVAEWIFTDYFDVMVYFEVLYVLMVFLGPKAMENREPYQLKALVAVWNLFLSLFSFCGTVGVGTLLIFLLQDRGMYETTCWFDKNYVYDGELSFWLMAFLLSKIPEMVDTLFLVLTKKPIIFLHWYHHLTVAVFCWYAGLSLIPSGLWFAGMNYAVHSIMYLYYFLCSLGLRRFIRPVAPLITGAQLLQMVIGTAVVLYTFYYSYFTEEGCGVDRRTIRMGLGMYGSYFALFATLFIHLYMSKGAARKKAAAAAIGEAGRRNGSAKAVSNGHGEDKKKK